MQKELLKYICCPNCKGNLQYSKSSLSCISCKLTFSIDNGIPILLDTHNMPDYLTHQITYFEEEDKTRPEYKLDEWQKSYLNRFDENIPTVKNAIILDIGAGSGYMAVELACKGAIVIASDLTVSQLHKIHAEVKKLKLEKNLFLVCCSAETLPFKNRIGDVVVENALLEHLPREKDAIDEISRVAKKKSSIMISVPLDYKYLWPFLIPLNLWHDKKIGHLRRYNKNDLVKKFPDFTVKRIYYTGHIVKFGLFIVSSLFKTNKFNKLSEDIDKKFEKVFYGGTVITAFFTR